MKTLISAQEFAQANPKRNRVSKLDPFLKDILYLREEGYTYQQITHFLNLNGIHISLTALRSFIKNRTHTQTANNKTNQTDNITTHTQIANKLANKFDWQKEINVEELK